MDKYLVKRKSCDINNTRTDECPEGKRQKKDDTITVVSNKSVETVIVESHPLLQRESGKTTDGKTLKKPCVWTNVCGENLNVSHTMLYDNTQASELLNRCEQELTYFDGLLAQIKIFGKWIHIPRKHVAHGDQGLTYSFSNNTIPAKPWTALLTEVRHCISQASGYDFNFVLINRYNGGSDYMGEHKDDEKDLCQSYPIASLSLGQARDFVFKHQDQKRGTRNVPPVAVQLKHGMLLLMKHPTNSFWYHSLPKRAAARGVRINMTFRKMDPSKCKPATARDKK